MENGNSLSDVENILVRLRCRRRSQFLGAAVQIQNMKSGEVLQEIETNTPKCWAV